MYKMNSRVFFSLKVFSVVLLLFLISLGLTMAVSDETDKIIVNKDLPPAEMTTQIVFEPVELVNMRNAISKTYDNGDGTYKAVIYINPIHYQAADGTWHEFDNAAAAKGTRSREIKSLQPGPTDGKDTMISDGTNADMNIGGDGEFWFSGEQNTVGFLKFRILLEFNIASLNIPPNADISSASLMLRYFFSQNAQQTEGGASTSISLTAYPISRSWVEGTGTTSGITHDGATWNDYDGSNPWSSAGGDHLNSPSGSGATPTSYGWTTIDVKNIVSEWISGTKTNYGFVVLSNTNHDFLKKFRTSDYTTQGDRPKLEIDYVSNYPPILLNPPLYNRFDLDEDQGVTSFDLDGKTRPSTGLFGDNDVNDNLVFYIWSGTTWVTDTGGGYVGSIIDANIETDGTLAITPKSNKFGSEEILLNATDSEGASKEYTLTVRVLPVNDPPKINDTTNWKYEKPEPIIEPGKITCQEDTWVNMTVTAWDPVEILDNRNLQYSVNSTKDYAGFFEINKNNGKVSFLPLNEDVGTYYLKIIVNDGNEVNNIAEFPFTLEVENINDKPIFKYVQIDDNEYEIFDGAKEYTLEESATEDSPFLFWVKVLDEDFYLKDYEEQLKFTITPSTSFSLDTYASFPDQVRVTFNPTNDDVGITSAYLRAEDKDKADSQIELKIEVINVNDPPEFVRFHYKAQEREIDSTELDLEKLGSGYKATEYSAYTFKIEGMDPDLEDTIRFSVRIKDRDEAVSKKLYKIDDIPNTPNTKQITVTPDQTAGREGEINVNITLTDNNNAKSWVVIRIPVENNNDPPVQPLIKEDIVDADRQTRIKENLTVKFEANYTSDIKYPDPDGDDDLTYTWDFGDGSDLEYGQFVEHTFPDSNVYTVILTVTDTGQLSNTTSKKIEVVKPKSAEKDDTTDGSAILQSEVAGIGIVWIILVVIIIVILLVLFAVMRSRSKKKAEEEKKAQEAAAAQQQAQLAQLQMQQQMQQYPMAAQYYQDPNMMAQYQGYQDQYQQLMMQQYPEQYQQMMAQQQYGYDQSGMGMTGQQQQYPYPQQDMGMGMPMTMGEGQYQEPGLPTTTQQPQMLPPAGPGMGMETQTGEFNQGESVSEPEPKEEIPSSPFANAETQSLEDELGKDAEVAEIPIEPSTEPVPETEISPDTESPIEPETSKDKGDVQAKPTPAPTPEPSEGGNVCKNCGASVKEGWFLCPKCKQPLI